DVVLLAEPAGTEAEGCLSDCRGRDALDMACLPREHGLDHGRLRKRVERWIAALRPNPLLVERERASVCDRGLRCRTAFARVHAEIGECKEVRRRAEDELDEIRRPLSLQGCHCLADLEGV